MTRFLKILFTATILSLLISSLIATESEPDWSEATPTEIHQKLWESKVKALYDRQISRQLTAQADIENTQTNYDVLFYDINIRINDTTEILYGHVRFVAEAAEDLVSTIQIDFFSNMSIDSIVAFDGTHLSYTRTGNVVELTLDNTYNSGEQFDFTFYYFGHPIEGGFQAFSFGSYLGLPVNASLSEPYYARTWWPCKDRMDDKADSFNIAIIVDTSMFVGSNGSLDSTIVNGDVHTFYYRVRYPMATYLFSVAASPYTVWEDEWVYNNGLDTMPIVNAVFPSRYSYSLPTLGVTPDALTYLSEGFGLYPFTEEKYGHSNFLWGGAMEHQTMTSTSYSNFGFSEPVVVHELGHQWWGDMITCKEWGHIWLNEGWASYSEAEYFLRKDGWASYHSYMNGMDYSAGGRIYVNDTTTVDSIFSSIVYDKGAWVVHMLRGVLGDQKFYDGIDAYYNSEYKFKAATTEEFRDVFEAATGEELDWFFEDWIYGTYRPTYRYSYFQEPSDTGGYDLYLRVEQRQTSLPTVFRMPVDFAFIHAGNPDGDTLTLKCDERDKLFVLNFPYEVTDLDLDPMNWVLHYDIPTSWTIMISTTDEDLHHGEQYHLYNDTIQQIGADTTSIFVYGGALPEGISIAYNGVISGATTDTGWFNFNIQYMDVATGKSDLASVNLYFAPSSDVPADFDGSGATDLPDLLYLVEYMFNFGPAPSPEELGDVNGDCQIDIADLLYLVNYMFDTGPAPIIGCS